MKRYLLFAGDEYYPAPGWHDFKNSYESVEQGKAAGENFISENAVYQFDWFHIVDASTGSIVYEHHYEER